MTDQRSGATPFNFVLVCVVLCRSYALAHMFIGRRWRGERWCVRLRCSSGFCPGFGAFLSFPHLFRSAFFISPTCCLSSRLWATCSLQIHLLNPVPYWYHRGEGFGRGCGMRSTIFILFPHSSVVEFEEAGDTKI
jgi:hypothetical protein